MDATEKSVYITQPSFEDLKILRGQIFKEQKTLFIKTCQINNEFMPGPEESRTPYPLLAKQTLYQMSYRPIYCFLEQNWALMDSNHRPSRYQHDALTS